MYLYTGDQAIVCIYNDDQAIDSSSIGNHAIESSDIGALAKDKLCTVQIINHVIS